jgi:hypothetical protein
MSKSAKMKASTPPKLMPPFHRTAASGTLPTSREDSRNRTPPCLTPQNGTWRCAT